MKNMKKKYFQILVFLFALLLFFWGVMTRASELICYNSPESAVINRLAVCESNVNYWAINKEDGGSSSYGLLQWKTASLAHFNAKYRLLPDIEGEEWLNIVYDPEIQIKMGKLVLKEPQGWKNWHACLRGMYE